MQASPLVDRAAPVNMDEPNLSVYIAPATSREMFFSKGEQQKEKGLCQTENPSACSAKLLEILGTALSLSPPALEISLRSQLIPENQCWVK